ncbi:unnamed protein product [Adineta steineri]|uniref:DUF5672 domain-containing protein n=1 Tax=Adineta steineri TaxID=433720 RepID=A0A819RA02_9BILA|nr:unnamed protein product [Adineta steineri]CAF4044536.1 unnamed protein product [Adineta steineri]
MCSNSPYKITDYLQYDYVGAPWPLNSSLPITGGNGGFSLRSRNKTITLLERMTFPAESGIPEDVWFSENLPTVGILPPRHVAKTFSVEGVFHENPMAVHKFYVSSELNTTQLKKIHTVCPEAVLIPPYGKI